MSSMTLGWIENENKMCRKPWRRVCTRPWPPQRKVCTKIEALQHLREAEGESEDEDDGPLVHLRTLPVLASGDRLRRRGDGSTTIRPSGRRSSLSGDRPTTGGVSLLPTAPLLAPSLSLSLSRQIALHGFFLLFSAEFELTGRPSRRESPGRREGERDGEV
eukprot:scaffold322557_cov31-Tisochrysis_lutea.AAC.1